MSENKSNVTDIPVPAAIDAEEFAVAEAAAATSTHAFTYTFPAPFSYEGKTYEELTFDWGKLTGNDAISIENEMQAMGKPVIVPEFSGDYLVRMAARACTVPISSDTILAMPISAYNKIRGAARSFLLRSGS